MQVCTEKAYLSKQKQVTSSQIYRNVWDILKLPAQPAAVALHLASTECDTGKNVLI